MSVEKIKALYESLKASTVILQEAMGFSYLEALFETLQNISDDKVQQIENEPSNEDVEKLEKIYQGIDLSIYDGSEIRKGIQLALLEGERKDSLQPNYQMTPEAIAVLIAYFGTKFMKQQNLDHKMIQLFDPVIGTGNLWSIVAQELMGNDIQVEGYGYDNDDLMISIAEKSLNLQGLSPKLYLGDSLQNLMAKPANLVVADLPVGYYPVDETAKEFTSATNGIGEDEHAYAHFLLIEQSLRYLQDNGVGIFLVPSNLFKDEKGMTLIKAVGQYGYFQALLNLPASLFQSKQAHKSILIVQKSGDKAKQAEHILIGDIPSLKDQERMAEFLKSFNNWLTELS